MGKLSIFLEGYLVSIENFAVPFGFLFSLSLVLVLRSSNSSSRNSQGINISLLRNQLEIEDRLTSGLVLRPSNSSESSSRTRASYSRTCRSSKSHSLLYTFVWQLVKSKKKNNKKRKKKQAIS